jgi:iron-sulfur cluster repair protein YtfE (RIC family)
MEFSNRVSQKLHEEHMATVALLERLERLVGGRTPPPAGDPAAGRLLGDLTTAFETEVWRHFDFEEEQLFTYLDQAGDAEIGAHLTDDHNVIRPIGARIIAMARPARTQGFDEAGWAEFRRLSLEMCERLNAHVQKEESALVPLLEEEMDAETEARLYEEYVLNG